MMKKKGALVFSVVVTLLFAAAFSLAQQSVQLQEVVVWGESPIYDKNVAQAKERALQEAFSAAVSKVMGTFVTAGSFSRNFVSIERSVLSKTKGYVKTYEILETKQGPDTFSLKLTVVVSEQSIKDDLTAMGILLDAVGNPILEIRGEDVGLAGSESAAVLKRAFAQQGFYVVEQNQDRDPQVIIHLSGTINSQNSFGGTGMAGAVIMLDGKAQEQGTRKIIASRSVNANGAGPDQIAALRAAYQQAAEQLAPQLIEAITEKWGQEITSGRTIQMTVEGIDYGGLQQFVNDLGQVFGVRKVDMKSFQDNTAFLLVRFTGQTKTLVDLLLKRPPEGLSVTVDGFDADQVTISIGKA